MIFEWLKKKIPVCSYIKKRSNSDDILIVCANNLSIYYFNSTATFFINEADGKKTIEDIEQKFLEEYDVDKSELEKDLVDMIRDLQWKQILILE